MTKNLPLCITSQTPANLSLPCGQDALPAQDTPELPQHPCGSRTYAPDEVFTDPGTLVMIGI